MASHASDLHQALPMRYMLLAYSPEDAWTQAEWTACASASTQVCKDLESRGQFIAAAPLHTVASAASVRVRHGEVLITAGPFAETTEQLGGFFLIDVPDLDAAIATAARLPSARKGSVELRPVFHLDGLPAERFSARPATEAQTARYMLLCYDDEGAWNELGSAALRAAQAEAAALTQHLDARGSYISASPLHPISTATSVRIRQDRLVVSNGPFAETREVLGGYYLITARDLNEALAVAAKHPGARLGSVEVRRLVELPDLPGA
jgi:hypothetical protein